ncbi:hypothetical protein [Olivibacter sp. XZL3]|uniref:hypothetical protein n=1 Tax=Olivibacter sp. XZL3 TaxID=1735116 RepID=UPI00106597E6|nr:hypothetical protein [Olivibacter sp. XZL3]
MENAAEISFEINAEIGGTAKTLRVEQQETSDGAPYYVCFDNDQHIAEIRKESNDHWVQLWGELDEPSISAIGKAIEQKELKNNG